MAGGQDFPDRVFTGKAVVHPGGIKVGEAPFEEKVHHLLNLFQVNIGGICRILRQPHQAEAQFLIRNKIHMHFLSVIACSCPACFIYIIPVLYSASAMLKVMLTSPFPSRAAMPAASWSSICPSLV